jgi:putative transcriptional regulator
MIRHHPSPDILADYARGSLREGAMLVVACHVELCATCGAEAGIWESVGGALLETLEPLAMSDGALERAMARLDGNARAMNRRPHVPRFLTNYAVPAALARRSIGFRRWVTPHIWFAPIQTAEKSPTYLVHADRNVTLPMHTHGGSEFTQVLHGSFGDCTGAYTQGDFVETDNSIHHAPSVTMDSSCLCLISSDASMQLAGFSARVLQTLLGGLY